MFPELDLNLVIWINLVAVVITLLATISAYRKEDLSERRFRILAKNYDSLLAQQLLKDMEQEDPERAKEIRAMLPKAPGGTSKITIDPGNTNPQEASLETLFMLERFRQTKEGEPHEPGS